MHVRRSLHLLIPVVLGSLSPSRLLLAQAPPVSAGAIYKQSAPSVVSIEGKNEKGIVEWTGTGFIVAADGKIVTNYHVIRNSKEASVRLDNGDVYDTVEVLDVDRRKDIALLKIKAIDLRPLRVGSSGAAQIGDVVYSLSNPLGLDNTLSEGIISGIRQMDGYRLLQITAPISHGSSGGPLFNAKGEVVGVTTLSLQEGQSLNFAIPIDYARGMLAAPSQPRPLASVYDPEPKAPTESAASPPTTAEAGSSNQDLSKKVGETIDGSWSATTADAKASGHLDFNLIQNSAGQVVGTYTSSQGGGGSIKGLLTGNNFRFELTQTITGCPGIYKGDGTRIGDNISGSYTGSDCLGDRGTGTFTMTRGASTQPATQTTSSTTVQIPDAMRKSLGDFLVSRLTVWTKQDAQAVMGEPYAHRYAYDQAKNVAGDIYSFRDPTANANHVELLFDSKTSRLTNIYLYPARTSSWDDCKKLWGKDVTMRKNPDGSKFAMYKNRHLNVLLDKNDWVISLGLY
jgi:hypothetical protein